MFTNRYIFTYAAVMVILVAAILSTASMVLKPFQEANVKAEKIQGILAAANIETSRAQAEKVYNQKLVEELAIDSEGDVISIYKDGKLQQGDVRPFNINLKEELQNQKEAEAGKNVKKSIWPLFILENNGQKYYVVPVRGTGLWGPIWGNLAFASDFNTVVGATFDDKSETPGLGAQIHTQWFEDQFKGKTIFDKNGKFVSIQVVKGGVNNSNIPPAHGVDAISGATITSTGVSNMLQSNLKNYVPYIKKNI